MNKLFLFAAIPTLALAQQNPFGQAASILQSGPPPPLPLFVHTIRPTPVKNTAPPASKPDLALSSSEQNALGLAKQWQGGDPLPTLGENGAVVYRFGAAMPPIVCAPERLTTIFLEPGERIQNQPIMGDTVRWEYELMTAGEGPATRTNIVLKPKRPNVATDMVLTTNKRTYQLSLVSKASEHLSRVEFTYPDAPKENWKAYEEKNQEAEKQKNTVAQLKAEPNFNYTVKVPRKTHPPFVPKVVYDDTHQTFLKMPAQAKDWSAAVLQTAGPNGCEIVNYRVAGDTWVIDRLFTNAELVSGTGKKAQRVLISRDGAPKSKCGSNGKTEIAKAETN